MTREPDPSVEGDKAKEAEDAELGRVLEAYLADLEAGLPADRERLLAAHPAIARELRACLQVMNLAERMVDASGSGSRARRPVPRLDSTIVPQGQSVLTSLSSGSGPAPRVHLRDLPDEPEPVVKPRSAEMPVHNGASLGRYQLQGEIARGGMGAILKGRDVDLGRDLALKVLLESHQGNPEVVSRFIEEAQIGGQLQHPGIAPVYELGTFPEPDRRPYFAMKLVKGQTLAALLQERTNPAHDLPRFLAIFEAICQTVAYAHARGVIHRDLKPSNVMVGSFGEVQVMDWGLAKVLTRGGIADESGASPVQETVIMTVRSGSAGSGSESQAGSVLGTPAYMAPEQARGEVDRIDERADVFGLGAILCEILNGRPPFVGSTREEIRAQAARGDLTDALRRLDTCAGEAELIGLARSCLAAERDARPRNAGEVARRMTAYLAGVQERLRAAEFARAEAQTKAAEERKRRRLTVALAASVLITASMVGGGWAYLARQRQDRATRVAIALGKVEILRTEADRAGDDLARWRTARDAAQAVEGLLLDAPDESTRRRAIELVRDVSQAAAAAENDQKLLAKLVDIRSTWTDDPDGSATDADFADAFRESGIDISVLPPAEAGARIQARPPSVRVALAAGLDDWAARLREKRADQAGALRLTEIARVADPDPWRNRLRELLQTSASQDRLKSLRDLARTARIEELPAVSLRLLGANLRDMGDPKGAEILLREGQRLFPGDVWINVALARCLERLGRRDEAIRYYMAARSLQTETGYVLAVALEANGETDQAISVLQDLARRRPKEGIYLTWLGTMLNLRGRNAEAMAILDAAIAASRAVLRLRPNYTDAHKRLGQALAEQGKLDEAITEYREALRLEPDSAGSYFNLAKVLHSQGKKDDAIAACRAALRLEPDFAPTHNGLAAVLAEQGKLDEALTELREAIRLAPDLSDARNNLAGVLFKQGKLDEAITEFREALRLKPDSAGTHANLGAALGMQGKLDEAIAEFREATRLKPDDHKLHNGLGGALMGGGKILDAIAEFREAIRLKPDDDKPHYNLGKALRDQGKLEDAVAEYSTALRLKPDYAEAHCNLGGVFREQGRFAEALVELKRGHELGSKNPNWQYPSAEWVRETERLVELDRKLPAIVSGQGKPSDELEMLGFAQLCYDKKLHGASARFWSEAFQAQPKLADDMQVQHRYNAACAAALAGSGQGKDDPPLDDAAKARWQKQAIDWLKTDLKVWSKLMESAPPQARQSILQTLQHWKADRDLAGLRSPAALAKLPPDEQKACQALWADVDVLLAKSQGTNPGQGH